MTRCNKVTNAVFVGALIACANIQGQQCPDFSTMNTNSLTNLAILVVRIWYLYSKSIVGRLTVIACFAVSVIGTIITASVNGGLPSKSDKQWGCVPLPQPELWRIFALHVGFHTVLYILTVIPAVRTWRSSSISPVMVHILREYVQYSNTADIVSVSDDLADHTVAEEYFILSSSVRLFPRYCCQRQ